MKKSPPLLTHYAGERSPPAPWANNDGDFFGDNFFGGARAMPHPLPTPRFSGSFDGIVHVRTFAAKFYLPIWAAENLLTTLWTKLAKP